LIGGLERVEGFGPAALGRQGGFDDRDKLGVGMAFGGHSSAGGRNGAFRHGVAPMSS
jgi:hypothetical protein